MKYVLLLITLLFPAITFSQSARIISLDQQEYIYIELLQKHGFLSDLNPTIWPISENQLRAAIEHIDQEKLSQIQKKWLYQIQRTFSEVNPDNEIQSYGYTTITDRHSSSDRQDVLRPLGNNHAWQPRIEVRLAIGTDTWAAQSGLTFDRFYDTDPDGFDTARRLYTRSEETYIRFEKNTISIRLGRTAEHWGGLSKQTSVLISRNPRSFDHLRLNFGNKKFSLTSIIGELDMLGSNGFYDRDRFIEGGKRRFVAAHRLDYRPLPNLQFSFFEGVLYSGYNAGLSLAYANPAHPFFFESDNDPKNYENNLQVGLGVWWQYKGWTISANGLLDDASYENRSDLLSSNQLEPASWSADGEVYKAGLVGNLDAFLKVDLVSSLSYRTDQREGQWSYAQRGLAHNFSDFIHAEFGTRFFFSKDEHALVLEPYVGLLQQGEGDFRFALAPRDPDGLSTDMILVGITAKTQRFASRFTYNYGDLVRFSGDIGVNFSQDENHIPGNNTVRPSGLVSLGIALRKR